MRSLKTLLDLSAADRPKLRAEVVWIAKENDMAIRDAWEYLLHKAVKKKVYWLAIVAKEEIKKDKEAVDGFMDTIEDMLG